MKVVPWRPYRSSRPERWLSVQTRSIVYFLLGTEIFQGRTTAVEFSKAQIQTERVHDPHQILEPDLSDAGVFQRFDSRPADAGFMGQIRLRPAFRFAGRFDARAKFNNVHDLCLI